MVYFRDLAKVICIRTKTLSQLYSHFPGMGRFSIRTFKVLPY